MKEKTDMSHFQRKIINLALPLAVLLLLMGALAIWAPDQSASANPGPLNASD